MINVHINQKRGYLDSGWLKSFHTFSFGEYYNPDSMGYRILRVFNEDHIQPGEGFTTHSHRDMEILSFVLDGELSHHDNVGNNGITKSGGVQYLSAGFGVEHTEFNASTEDETHFLQVWILPRDRNLLPHYTQKHFNPFDKHNKFKLIVSEDGFEDSLTIRQDVKVYSGILQEKQHFIFVTHQNRYYWLHVARGAVKVNEHVLEKGDSASIFGERVIHFKTDNMASELLLLDLP